MQSERLKDRAAAPWKAVWSVGTVTAEVPEPPWRTSVAAAPAPASHLDRSVVAPTVALTGARPGARTRNGAPELGTESPGRSLRSEGPGVLASSHDELSFAVTFSRA